MIAALSGTQVVENVAFCQKSLSTNALKYLTMIEQIAHAGSNFNWLLHYRLFSIIKTHNQISFTNLYRQPLDVTLDVTSRKC